MTRKLVFLAIVTMTVAALFGSARSLATPVLASNLFSNASSFVDQNIALGRPVDVTTNGANDNRESPGLYPSDIVDGSLAYIPSSLAQEDGSVGFVNDDYDQLMSIQVTIDLQSVYSIHKIRYNMGNVQLANTWNADVLTTPFGSSATNPGGSFQGAWTEHTGNAVLSEVTITLQKTRTTFFTDWLFIGEIEIYGEPVGSYLPQFDLPFDYPNRGNATETEFVYAWQRCTTAFFDHKFPGEKGNDGDGYLWMWTGDILPGTNCTLGENCYDGHEGYDFDDFSCFGNMVYPAATGQVTTAGWQNDGYGNRVVISHSGSGYTTLYGHLSEIYVSVNDLVNDLSTPIGKIGNSGCPGCGTHLHFNVYRNNELVDPSGWDGSFPDPYVEEENGPVSYRQWLFPVQRKTPVNATLGTELVAPSGNTVAFIPENSYPEDFNLSLTELSPLWIPSPLAYASHGALFSATGIGGNPIAELDEPFVLEFTLIESEIAFLDFETLGIYLWDGSSSAWTLLPTTITLVSSAELGENVYIASTSLEQLGFVALFGLPENQIFIPSVARH